MAEITKTTTSSEPTSLWERKEIKNLSTAAEWTELAKLAEHAERYEDMCHVMQTVVVKRKEAGEKLNTEERNMLSVAYKNAVGRQRSAWRHVSTDADSAGVDKDIHDKYLAHIESNMKAKCNQIVELVSTNLLDKENPDKDDKQAVETQVFYLKMCGDYYRYMAEFTKAKGDKDNAQKKYEQALKIAVHLAPTHPTRLGLALNASVCFYEILNDKGKAKDLAKEAFDQAIQKLDSLNDNNYKDSTLIMQLLRDNLTLWSADAEENGTLD